MFTQTIIAQSITCVNAITSKSNWFNGGTDPSGIVNADFNGDTFKDMAVAYSTSNQVGIFMGNGAGNFSLSALYNVGTNPISLVAADLNGDGFKDLGCTNYGSQNISILFGTGVGSFSAAINYTVGSNPTDIKTGNFNGDIYPDIFIVNPLYAYVLINNGLGGFPTATQYLGGLSPKASAVNDFNGDGNTDIAVACFSSNSIELLIGNGLGTFSVGNNIPAITNPIALVTNDFNGDAMKDLAVLKSGPNNVAIYTGIGNATFSNAANYSAVGVSQYMITDEMNNDSKPDLIIRGDGYLFVFNGIGNGTFQNPLCYSSAISGYMTSGDFNGDGFKDLAASSAFFFHKVFTIMNSGNGLLRSARIYFPDTDLEFHTVNDFNNDGFLDIASTHTSGIVSIMLNNGNSDFLPPLTFSIEPSLECIESLDMNSDGNMDLIIGTGLGNCHKLYGNGTGSFSLASTTNANMAFTFTLNVNNDNLVDLAYTTTGGVSIMVNNGNGTFGGSGLSISGNPASVASGDFNNDGENDILVTKQNSSVYFIFLNTGGGNSFSGPITFSVANTVSYGTAGDYDNDGNCDLALASNTGIEIKKGDGTGNFTHFNTYPYAYGSPGFMKTLDFNGDSKLDVLMLNQYQMITILTGNNNCTFNPSNEIITRGSLKFECRDFNNDNAIDLSISRQNVNVIYGGMKAIPVLGLNSFCIGQGPITLSTSASPGTFTWSTGSTSASIIVQPSVTTTYSITKTGVYGCSSSNQKTVTVNPLPTINILSSNDTICNGNSAVLTVSGAATYTWSTGSTTTSISISPSVTTTYSVLGNNVNNCSNNGSYTLVVDPCTSIKENKTDQLIRVYPNPSNDLIHISMLISCELKIYNVLGKLVLQKELSSKANDISISELKPGMYLLEFTNEFARQSLKLLIN